jgi:hypothetical protein
MTCSCPPDVAALVAGELAGESAPPCSAHRLDRTAAVSSVALNADDVLLGPIRAALGVAHQPHHPQGDSRDV